MTSYPSIYDHMIANTQDDFIFKHLLLSKIEIGPKPMLLAQIYDK